MTNNRLPISMSGRNAQGRFVAGNTIAQQGWRGLVDKRFDGDTTAARAWLAQLGRHSYARQAIGGTMTDVYFQSEKLPPLRTGKVWGVRLYPGGRKEVRQCDPGELTTPTMAVRALRAGHVAHVWLDDAVDTAHRWEQVKAVQSCDG